MNLSATCFLFVSALTATAVVSEAAVDARFGLVGTGGTAFAQKLGLTYYALEGNYPASGNIFSSVDPANDPAAGYKVLRKVAKLNVRNDNLGQTNAQFETALNDFATALVNWHSTHIGTKPTFPWYAPTATSLSAAESLQIITTIRREKARVPVITGTVWEIGNEPNLFPALLPANYAAIYARYYKIIKQEDPAAKVAMGPVFVREVAMDLILRVQEIFTQRLIERGLGSPGQPLFDSVNKDVWLAYSSRTLNLGTVDYFAQSLAALDSSVHPDIISLHVYPFEDRLPILSEAQTKKILDSLADSLGARLQSRTPNVPVWITEFGNINPGFVDEQVAAQASSLIDVFMAKSRFQNWFYYKATGFDTQLLGLAGQPTPLTRLARDSAFDPVDGNFACGRMNAVGRMYYLRSNGVPCTEKAGFATAASAPTGTTGTPATPTTFRVRLSRAEVDTVKLDVVKTAGSLEAGTAYTQSPSTLVFAPGDTSRTVTLTWNNTAAGNATFKLRNPVNVGITVDSIHTVTYTVSGPEAQAGFVLPASMVSYFGTGPNFSIPVRLNRNATDTIRVQVVAKAGGLKDTTHFTLQSHTLVFVPGDTAESIQVQLKGSIASDPTVTFALRSSVPGKISADSLHTVTVSFIDAVLPGLPGADLSLDPTRAALVFTGLKAADVSVRLLDASGKTRGTLQRRTGEGRTVILLKDAVPGGVLPAGLYHVEVSGPGFRKTFRLSWLNP